MERTCFRFVPFISIFSNSFVFITKISYILFHLMLRDKCSRCVFCYLLSSTERIPCDTWERISWNFNLFLSTKTVSTCFFLSLTHVTTFPIGSSTSSFLSALSPTEDVMNENVLYVMPCYTILLFSISKFHSVFI